MSDSKPILSVVILTYNSPHELSLVFEGMMRQTFPSSQLQIIVVDDGSSDNTPEVIARYAIDLPIESIRIPHRGIRGENRNLGASRARADRILFLDGDIIPTSDFLARHESRTRGSDRAISMGKRRRLFATDSRSIRPDV